jgi:quinol-cytochrome oxidoreductase complex cytochrome b subunit
MEKQDRNGLLKALPIDIKSLYEKADEPLPHSAKRWWWCWGGIPGLLFAFLALSGLLLAIYYRAEPETTYKSIAFITEEARYGQFVRSVHRWGATFMIVCVFLHMLRTFVTAAFRDYRWGAWAGGVLLLALTLGMGFTGYALVYDQKSYWGLTITSNIISTVPLIGDILKSFFLAGDQINAATLSRMYALHALILPAALVALVLGHLFFVRLMGLYLPGNKRDQQEEQTRMTREGAYHFYPDHLASEFAVFLYIVLVISLLALVFPATMGEPANPSVTPEHIKPEWYFYPFYHLLKIVPGTVGVTIIGIFGIGLFLWPVLDHYLFQRLDRSLRWRLDLSLVLGLIVAALFLFWTFIEA